MINESPNPYIDRFDYIKDISDLDPAILIGIEGSLGEERKRRASRDVNSDYRLYVKLQKSYTFQLSSLCPENFYKSLAEVTTLYPHLPGIGDIQVFGLNVFESSGGSTKWRDLLVYLAYKPDDFFFISEILISRLVTRLRPDRKLEGSWLELRDLLLVFGQRDCRLEYLELRYTKRALGNMKKRGKTLASYLRISLVKNTLVKPIQRKLGYNDHGSTSEKHERHGDKEGYEIVQDSEKQNFLRIYHYIPAKFEYKRLKTVMKSSNWKHPERPPTYKKVYSGQKVVKSFTPSEFDFEIYEDIKEEDLMNNGPDLNQLLVDIFKNATLNYLAWLERETNPNPTVLVEPKVETSSPKQ